jgi:competence protein ComEA
VITRHQSLWALVIGLAMFVVAGALWAGPVNINTADASTLSRELKGIGMKRAQAIVDYRTKNGPFKSVDELTLVKGIGPAALAKNREFIRTELRPVSKGAQNSAPASSSRR